MTTIHLTDQDRADPWVPQERREPMVSLWYPARKPSRVPAPYLTAEESRKYVDANRAVVPKEVPSEVPATVATGDMASVGKQLGIPLQPLDGDRCDALLRAYVTAFADTHLKGRPAPLLDGPSASHPEVGFHG